MLTVLTLNLWGYKDWSHRKSNVVELLKTVDADIVALQEVQQDGYISENPQSSILASLCGYKYTLFQPACSKQGNAINNTHILHGLALLSKHKIITHSVHMLNKHNALHEQCIILTAKLRVADSNIDICNVHFHNTDKTSLLHLKETMRYIHDKNINPIIFGDFNNYNLNKFKHLMPGYVLSSDFVDYSSFIKDNGILDYIAIPDNCFKFLSVHTSIKYVSDHKALWSDLKIDDRTSDD